MIYLAADLDRALKAVGLPIDGVSIGRRDDRATWLIQWRGSPTDRQIAESVRILSTFDPAADKTTTARTKKGTAKKKRSC